MSKKGRRFSKKAKGPGQKLKLAREERKLTVDEVAAQLRLSPDRLSDIEGDDYHELGSPAFARGYLRNYARLMSVSEEEILEEFDKRNLSKSISSVAPHFVEEGQTTTFVDRLTRWIVLGLATISIIGTITWLFLHRNDQDNMLSIEKIKQLKQTVKEAIHSPAKAHASTSTVIVEPLPIQSVSENTSTQTQSLPLPKVD